MREDATRTIFRFVKIFIVTPFSRNLEFCFNTILFMSIVHLHYTHGLTFTTLEQKNISLTRQILHEKSGFWIQLFSHEGSCFKNFFQFREDFPFFSFFIFQEFSFDRLLFMSRVHLHYTHGCATSWNFADRTKKQLGFNALQMYFCVKIHH